VVRAFLVFWLALAALMGGFDVRFQLVRPECCHSVKSCCLAGHGADCCHKKLEVTVTGKRDESARAADSAPSRAPSLELALMPTVIDAAAPIALAEPIAPEPRLDAHPPDSLTQTTILRL